MSIDDSGTTSSEERPVALRMRNDLVVEETWYQSERSWIVKDPLALQYFRLREPEYCVLKMLDGTNSLRDIQQRLIRLFPERVVRLVDVQQLIGSLNRQGILLSNSPGKAAPLLEQAGKLQRQKALKLFSSALSLRLPGLDPEPLLGRLYPLTRWFFSRWCTVFCLSLGVAAVALLLGNLDEFLRRLPEFQQFFALQNVVALGLLLMVTKTLHEIGHGLFCKHFGGECHEIGLMFLVLMPAMYCDTSDSWRLPSKWHRMAIGAAGMYVEILLAALCTFVWWYTHPGWLHYLCLNVMFLCSVSTVLFNGNPLLRYDGYYILSDWLEVPNLSQKARSAMLSKLRVTFLGMEPVPSRQLPRENITLFAIYSVLSVIYRWFVLMMILWLLSVMFEPYGLQAIGHFLIGLSLVGLIGVPFWKLFRFFSYPGRRRQVNKKRMIVTLTLLAGFLAVVFLVPFRYHVTAHLVIQPSEAQRVYVAIPGVVSRPEVHPGQHVAAGQLLAKLENVQERIRLEKIRGQVAVLENEISRLNQLNQLSALVAPTVISKQVELTGMRNQLELQRERLESLQLRSNRAGIVVPPPNVFAKSSVAGEPGGWSGTPFDTKTYGAYLDQGTWFCSVAEPDRWEAVLMIPQSDVQLIAEGNDLRMMLDEYPGDWLHGTLIRAASERVDHLPRELTRIAGGPLAGSAGDDSGDQPLLDYFQATARVDSKDLKLAQGFRGRAKVYVGRFTLAWRVGRFFRTVFNFS